MRKAIWTLVTQPPDLAIAARPDENVAKVHVEPIMPLFLQLVSKQADLGPNLFTLPFVQLLLACSVIAAADATGYLCRPKCTGQKSASIQDENLKHYSTCDSKQDNTPVQKGC